MVFRRGFKAMVTTFAVGELSFTMLILFVFGGVLFKTGCQKILTNPAITGDLSAYFFKIGYN